MNFRGHQKFIRTLLDGMGFETEMWEVDAAQLENGPGRGVRPDRDMSGMPVVVGQLPGAVNVIASGDRQSLRSNPPTSEEIASPNDGQHRPARNDMASRSLILNGHYDVVPEGDAALWMYDPYSATLAAGRMYGRGTADMKGGNAAMLFAVKMIQQAGLTFNGDLTVQIAPDEEATCMGTLACCLRGYTADAAFIPEPTNMGILVAMRGSVYGTITVYGRAG
ncbi:MAG: M20/M25/M40 family metallo-hydrolase, partial [Anaerolineae bacterium]|nr:M20/M25/M40 family metallo-hydrolase [Anaerolineae bacterium]